MPIYDTVMQEKPPVVLDIGAAYTKLGFAAEAHPRFIIPTETTVSTTGKIKNLFDYCTNDEFYDQIVDFFQMIFFKHVLVSPKDRKIVLVESTLCPTLIRETLARALFKHFEVSSIFYVPLHLSVLSTLAIESAIVVDLGYNEGSVIPVYCGVQILKAFQAELVGADAVHKEIKRQLMEAGVKEDCLTETILEDIKIRCCFVTTMERAEQYRSGNPPSPPPDVDYPIKEKEVVKISGALRETAFEVMFSLEEGNIALMILNSLLDCNIDMRKSLADNIVLIGGSSMIMGLQSRLKSELINYLKISPYADKLHLNVFKFHKTIGRCNFTGWLGGSIYGGTDLILTKSLNKEQYIKHQKVPDWINLDDNRAPAS